MIDPSVLILVLGSIAMVAAAILLNNWFGGRIHIRSMAQVEEGYRQAICSADEFQNKMLAAIDHRIHSSYRQAAHVQGKPPAVRNHDAAATPMPEARVLRGGASRMVNQESVAEAQRKIDELEALAVRNGMQTISSPADYGAREPE